jgi:hypothetical protein
VSTKPRRAVNHRLLGELDLEIVGVSSIQLDALEECFRDDVGGVGFEGRDGHPENLPRSPGRWERCPDRDEAIKVSDVERPDQLHREQILGLTPESTQTLVYFPV